MQNDAQGSLRGSLPHLNDEEFNAVHEALRRYARLATDIVKAQSSRSDGVLTTSPERVRVSGGEVDPGTLITTRE